LEWAVFLSGENCLLNFRQLGKQAFLAVDWWGDFSTEVTHDKEADSFPIALHTGYKWVEITSNLVQALRLFKPGSFASGADWLCVTSRLRKKS
jgi:hypothetical protein